jgi:hypothetical protein
MWDGLRHALASEGREIYAQMVQGLQAEVGGPHHYESACAETLEPDTTGRLRAWWNRLRFIRGHRVLQAAEREAHDRGIRLLIKNLSPAQRAQYDAFGYFEVTGGETGKRYRITKAYQMNVLEKWQTNAISLFRTQGWSCPRRRDARAKTGAGIV